MNWDLVHNGFMQELGKIAAFHVGNLSHETVLNNAMPPGPMETTGLQKAREILARMDSTEEKIASDVVDSDHPYHKIRPWVNRAVTGAGMGTMLSGLTQTTPNLKRRATGAAIGAGAALADKAYMAHYRKSVGKTKTSSLTDPAASLRSAQKIGRFSRVATTNMMGKAGPGIKQQVSLIGHKGTLPGIK